MLTPYFDMLKCEVFGPVIYWKLMTDGMDDVTVRSNIYSFPEQDELVKLSP